MAINWIGQWTVEQCRAAADAHRNAIKLWQTWLDTGKGPHGDPLPEAAVGQLRRWVADSTKTAAEWDAMADARGGIRTSEDLHRVMNQNRGAVNGTWVPEGPEGGQS